MRACFHARRVPLAAVHLAANSTQLEVEVEAADLVFGAHVDQSADADRSGRSNGLESALDLPSRGSIVTVAGMSGSLDEAFVGESAQA